MSDDQKQSLAFARVVLQKPNWVVANDALDILNPTSRKRIRDILQGALSYIGIINIGHDVPEPGVYHYKVRLVSDPHGPAFELRLSSPKLLTSPRPRSRQADRVGDKHCAAGFRRPKAAPGGAALRKLPHFARAIAAKGRRIRPQSVESRIPCYAPGDSLFLENNSLIAVNEFPVMFPFRAQRRALPYLATI